MSEASKNPFEPFFDEIRRIVREENQATISQNGHQGGDKLLTAEKAAEILSVSPDWLYRHGSRLPFTSKLAPRVLRFSYQGTKAP